ncbi:MAG: hypothetical protein KJN94_03460, partial [Gammaproteobacteria bacterium]|nr:hypothetical protein [Gammaproteobacteria bacterium]
CCKSTSIGGLKKPRDGRPSRGFFKPPIDVDLQQDEAKKQRYKMLKKAENKLTQIDIARIIAPWVWGTAPGFGFLGVKAVTKRLPLNPKWRIE